MPRKKTKKTKDPVKVKAKEELKQKKSKEDRYIEAVGRRKRAIARLRFKKHEGKEIFINDKKLFEYFPPKELQEIVFSPLYKINLSENFKITIKVKGGGVRAQAEAIRHALARALVKSNEDFKKRLKKAGFLTRDPRERERKKFGLKRARRAPQWSKR